MTDLLSGLIHLTSMLVLPGLAYGSQLAFGALGVTLIFGVLRFSNFAHAEGMSLGTAVCILLTLWLQGKGIALGPLPTALIGMCLAVPVMALVFIGTDRALYQHFRRINARPEVFMIVSAGVMLIMNGAIRLIVGPDGREFEDGERFIVTAGGFRAWSGLAEPLVLKTSQAMTIGLALSVGFALFLFLNRTRSGRSMRAYADNRNLALLSGVDPDRIVRLTWVLVAVLSVTGGVLFGLDKGYRPFVYQQLLLPMFAAAVVGGLGSPLGAIAGSMIVAFSELALTFAWKKALGYLLPAAWAPEGMMQFLSTDYKFAISFLILVVVLLVRPAGLFGKPVK
ncbi:branched-chain amino acid ABC transporter permease [Rhizobium sp. YJ-22]|uniref:branched-chain amino acid ABC transporter permease n=1 Tax=Rhizobium sp. YJ-22 TaxID=3037556 RepID=UPI0024124860|nr:branched-chain amino acid ABC transporter permease [Rhizobium sp. YJ-22]MDG3580013.1 branched-chain amino acid ABC transporter permease [Rhizobium sp. YJ-22]